MQIKLFTMVKNEVDIVIDWTFYHGTIFGYNNLYIIDNNSNDGTFEQLIKFKSLGVNLVRKSDYSKKGEYMTHYYNKFCEPDDIGYPIDIDEFIVYYDKSSNKISTSRKKILNYLKSLPPAEIYKTNYIQATPNQDSPDGYRRAVAECKWGFYDGNYKENAKSFMKKKFYSGPIDHGNHIPTKNYYLKDISTCSQFRIKLPEQSMNKLVTIFGEYHNVKLNCIKNRPILPVEGFILLSNSVKTKVILELDEDHLTDFTSFNISNVKEVLDIFPENITNNISTIYIDHRLKYLDKFYYVSLYKFNTFGEIL